MTEYMNNDGEIMRAPFMRTPYNYDMDAVSHDTGLTCKEPTMAQQQFKDDCDINVIMERFGMTGELPQDIRVPVNEDFWEVKDFQGALNQINAAREAFMELPAKIRSEFDNDPGKFVDFVSDDTNREKAKKLGILVPEKEPEKEPAPIKVVMVQPEGETGKK